MKNCMYNECKTLATFGIEGTKQALFCKQHKLHIHVDVLNKFCLEPNCGILSTYGIEGTGIPLYCNKHKLYGYVDVKHKTCLEPNCKTQPSYGIEGNRIPLYCVKHKLQIHVDVINKICLQPDCRTQPSYGIEGTKQALYCVKHKLQIHVDVRSKVCLHPNCGIQPTYGIKGTKQALYCVKHKLQIHDDVINKMCLQAECGTQPSYGIEGTKTPLYCQQHKLSFHVNVISKTCSYFDCKTQPQYGIPGYSSEFCTKHKDENLHIRYPHRFIGGIVQCIVCSSDIHYTEKVCKSCFSFMKLNRTQASIRKEIVIKNLLDEEKIRYVHDSAIPQIDTESSKRRPDFRIETEHLTIILEVDEFQHNKHECSCEIKRMREIYQSLNTKSVFAPLPSVAKIDSCPNGVLNTTDIPSDYRKVLFIRYNPDTYKPLSGKILSQNKRQELLIKYLEMYMSESYEQKHPIGVIYLFFDGYTSDQDIDYFDLH